MRQSRMNLGQLSCVVLDGGPQPTHLVVLCHGYGAPGDGLAQLGSYLMQTLGTRASDYRFVFPAACLSLDDQNIPGGRAWWPLNMQRLMELFEINDFSQLRTEQPPGIDQARQMLTESIEAAVASIDGPVHLAIGGFSQGAMLAMDVALRGLKQAPEALILYSGTLICEAIWSQNIQRLANTHVLQSHGYSDMVLPMIAAQWLGQLIEPAAASYQMIPFDGPHTIPFEALKATGELLTQLD